MIKRTLYFSNPAKLSMRSGQLVIESLAEQNGQYKIRFGEFKRENRTVSIEDIGVVVIDGPQVSFTSSVISSLLEENVAFITCDSKHMPTGLMLNLSGNSIQSERFRKQIEASLPLKKQLWKQTVEQKIRNQAAVLKFVSGKVSQNMLAWSNNVRSGDVDNLEGRAAVYYWKNLFPSRPDFLRGQEEAPPNNLLNYGYAILRGIIARALVSSGLLPTLGIHHHNRYNAYCLADDIMEPYRPYVDCLIIDILSSYDDVSKLTTDIKKRLLSIPVLDVHIEDHRSPLMVAASTTSASVAKCFEGSCRRISYPSM